jgi:mannose-6-phosphate isomerase-like protein (cupin superfamily)
LIIKPNSRFMIINNSNEEINVKYSMDISHLEIIYDPYKFENIINTPIDPDKFIKIHSVPGGFSEILPKWYSIKFTYPNHNLIYIKPEMGISIQLHQERSEKWEILKGHPIIINGNKVYYHVKNGSCFSNPKNFYHSVINPNKKLNDFVVIKEKWAGNFDENDIIRVFNPNHYFL